MDTFSETDINTLPVNKLNRGERSIRKAVKHLRSLGWTVTPPPSIQRLPIDPAVELPLTTRTHNLLSRYYGEKTGNLHSYKDGIVTIQTLATDYVNGKGSKLHEFSRIKQFGSGAVEEIKEVLQSEGFL